MSNRSPENDTVYEGWLIKSPPTKLIWRARWRRRWFVLRTSSELPGQYFLEYYTDRNCRKLKGRIDLDQCEQVDVGLHFEDRKQKYQYMFDLRTPKRLYYLAADTEEDMNRWVEYVCHVCGLRACKTDDDDESEYGAEDGTVETGGLSQPLTLPSNPPDSTLETGAETPPVSPTSTISGPYIPISECISGKPLSSPDGLEDFRNIVRVQGNLGINAAAQYGMVPLHQAAWLPNIPNKRNNSNPPISSGTVPSQVISDEFYDSPRKLQPPNLELRGSSGTPPLQSPTTDGESVFTDDEWAKPVQPPSVNWETFPTTDPPESNPDIGSWSVMRKFGKLHLDNPPAPPRPPKPSHLTEVSNQDTPVQQSDSQSNEDNSEAIQVTQDEMYDFPRSHQYGNSSETATNVDNTDNPQQSRHCYSNAAPTEVKGTTVFRYDFRDGVPTSSQATTEEPTSPRSDNSITLYSNLPSPHDLKPTPPAVNRGLKPRRKLSDSTSLVSSEPSPGSAPCVDRKLKPQWKYTEPTEEPLKLASPPASSKASRAASVLSNGRKPRAAPSPTPPSGSRKRSDRNSSSDDDHHHIDEEGNSFHPYMQDNRFLTGVQGKRQEDLQYVDLDHETDSALGGINGSTNTLLQSPSISTFSGSGSLYGGTQGAPKSPERVVLTNTTVYKTVDFIKTEAFNLTRQLVEEERNKVCS